MLFGRERWTGRIITNLGGKRAFTASTPQRLILKQVPAEASDRSSLTCCRILLLESPRCSSTLTAAAAHLGCDEPPLQPPISSWFKC